VAYLHPIYGGETDSFQQHGARTPDVRSWSGATPAPLLGAINFCLPPGVERHKRPTLGLSPFGPASRIRPPSIWVERRGRLGRRLNSWRALRSHLNDQTVAPESGACLPMRGKAEPAPHRGQAGQNASDSAPFITSGMLENQGAVDAGLERHLRARDTPTRPGRRCRHQVDGIAHKRRVHLSLCVTVAALDCCRSGVSNQAHI